MKTYLARRVAPAVMMVVMIWAATCRGQGLEIDIPVPDPAKPAAHGKEAAKRKAPLGGRESRAWEGAVADREPAPLPTWGNPAAIPLRQPENAAPAPMPKSLDRKASAASPSSHRTPASRADSSPNRIGLFGRAAAQEKGQSQADKKQSTPLLARRHRAATREHAEDSPAPPSPWGSNR